MQQGSAEIVIYGSRPDGHAKVVLELLESLGGWSCAGCLDDTVPAGSVRLRGLPVLGGRKQLGELSGRGIGAIALGFGDGGARADLLAAIRVAGLALPRLVHSAASVAESAIVGAGTQMMQNAIVEPNAVLGEAAVLYQRASVGSGAAIADGVTLAPSAVVEAGSRIGRGASVGAAAAVLAGVEVGAGVTIGAAAVVADDVPDGATVAGVPAAPLRAARG